MENPSSKIKSFFAGLTWGLSYYENIILRFISFGLLLCSIGLIYYSPGKWRILFSAFAVFLLFKEFYNFLELENKENKIHELEQGKDEEIQKAIASVKKDVVHTLLEFLGKFFNWKGGFRFTIFTLSRESDVECIRASYRTAFGSLAGVPIGHKAYFTKGKGLPGKAWADAWDKENLEDLIDRIKIGNIPGSYLTDSEKLKEYFKKTFDVTDEIFDALGDEKYQIKSYLAIGIVGLRSELSYVLSIDSTEDDAFDDFQTAKVLKDARLTEITHIQGAIEAAEEETDEEVAQVARTDSIEKQDNILPKVEIPEEILRELPPEGRKFFEALAEGKYPQISGVAFEIMGQTGIRRPNIDRFVYTLGMILKLLEVIIQKRYPLMKEVSKV